MNVQPQRRKQRRRPQQRRDSLLSRMLAAANGPEFLALIRAAGEQPWPESSRQEPQAGGIDGKSLTEF